MSNETIAKLKPYVVMGLSFAHLTCNKSQESHMVCPLHQSYQFSMLSCHCICILDQCLELVVLSECDDFQHSAKL